jgi:WD40 repeat protein
MRNDPATLDRLARRAVGVPIKDQRLVVVVDQFEEVFTLCEDAETRQVFIANLLAAASSTGGPAYVVIGLRANYYDRSAAIDREFADVLLARHHLVRPLTRDELRRAIEYPARRVGLEFEPGLVELLLEEVQGQAGALPLLQVTLRSLWERRDGRRLSIRSYHDPGGLTGALILHAEAVYATFTDSREQEICRQVFLRLVQLGEGSEDTRRRASLSEVLPDDPAQAEAVRAVIRRLADSRLITIEREKPVAGEGTLEVAHEGLIRGWPRLRTWVDAEREGIRVRQRLTEAAREWADADPETKEAYLYTYTGARMVMAKEWAETHRGDLNATEAAFLAASEAAERRRVQETLDSERLLREAAEAVDKRQKRLRLRFLVAAVVAGLFAAISFGLAFLAINKRYESILAREHADAETKRAIEATQLAKAQARIATSRQLAALSASERNKRLDRSLLLAIEALRTENTFEARDSLYKALQDRPGLTSFLHMSEGRVANVAFSPDGKTIAAGYSGFGVGGVVLWDVIRRQRLDVLPLSVKEGDVWSVAFSPNGKTIAAGYAVGGGGVVLWDVAARKRLADDPLPVNEGGVTGVSFSPDGKTIAAGYAVGGGGGVVLWDVARRQRLEEERLPVREGRMAGVSFSPDGKTIAAAYAGRGVGGVVLWDVAARKRLADDPLPVKEGEVRGVSFSPDGKTIAAGYVGGGGGGVVLWDVAARKRLADGPLPVKEGGVTGVSFSPDGKTIAAGYGGDDGGDGGVVLWDVTRRQQRLAAGPLPVREGRVAGVVFSPDGKTLAAGYYESDGGGVVLWDVARRQRLEGKPLSVREGRMAGVSFSPDSKTLAAGYDGGDGGGVVLWDVAVGQRLADDPLPVN